MSLVNSLVQDFRAQVPEFDKNEFRIMQAGMLNTFQKQTNSGTSWVTPDLIEKAKMTTANNDVTIPVIDYKDVTIRTTRPLTIAADENTSQLYTVVWTTFAYGFLMYPAQHFNNDISYQRDFNAKMKAMLVKMTTAIEDAGVTAIASARTQVVNEVTGGHTFTLDTVHEIAADYKSSYVIGDLMPMMNSNDFYSVNLDVVGNQGLQALLRRQEGFGEQNSENQQWQWNNNNFAFTNGVANIGNKKATGYAINEGTLGLLSRVEPDAMMRNKTRDGYEWDTVMLPGLNIEFGSYSYETAVDASSVGAHATHLTRTKMQAFDFAVDLAFLVPYNSDQSTIPSPIIKFDFNLTSGS